MQRSLVGSEMCIRDRVRGERAFFVLSFRGPYHSSSKLAILSSRHLREDKLAILSSRHLGEDSVLKKKNLVCWWGWDIKFFFRRVGGLTNWDVQVCSTYQLGVLQVGMSKFVQHTNHLPEKNLINYSQGGARIFLSYHSGALTTALLSWPSFHQDILEKTSWPSFHQDILEKTVC